MAFLLPKLSLTPTLPYPKPSQNGPARPLIHLSLVSPPLPSALTKLEPPPGRDAIRGNLTASHDKQKQQKQQRQNSKNDFYLNLGLAVRTLRDDLPSLFSRDLNYDIYRDNITFIDPLNTFHGIENYKLIFWALRFHGRILFREIGVEIFRVWQPSETSILIRWELRGVPRVPWESRGRFQGTSRYKLDREGKIYEHKVDNLAFNFPRTPVRPATVLDLVAPPATPNLTFRWNMWEDARLCSILEDRGSCSWLELYRAVMGTLESKGQGLMGASVVGLVTCS